MKQDYPRTVKAGQVQGDYTPLGNSPQKWKQHQIYAYTDPEIKYLRVIYKILFVRLFNYVYKGKMGKTLKAQDRVLFK